MKFDDSNRRPTIRILRSLNERPKPSLSPVSRMAFTVSVFAFGAAGLDALAHYRSTSWMAIGGMAGIGLFYLLVGLVNLKTSKNHPGKETRNRARLNVQSPALDRPARQRIQLRSSQRSPGIQTINHE